MRIFEEDNTPKKTFQLTKKLKILLEVLALILVACFFGSYFMLYPPTMLCFIYRFNLGTGFFFLLAWSLASYPVIFIINYKKMQNEFLLYDIISKSCYFVVGMVIRWVFILYQRQGCGNVTYQHIFLLDAFLANLALLIIFMLIFEFIKKKKHLKQNNLEKNNL